MQVLRKITSHHAYASAYAQKQSWGPSLWQKYSCLLLPNSCFYFQTPVPSSQLQGALLIFETFLSGFFSVFWSFLSTFAQIFPTQYHRDVQNKAQERQAHVIRSSGFQRIIWLKRIGKILNRKWPYECMKLDHLTLINCHFASSKHNSSH